MFERVDIPFPKILANNVQFWLEVNKFKVNPKVSYNDDVILTDLDLV